MNQDASRRHERISVPAAVEIHATGPGLTGIATVVGMGGMFLRAKETQPAGTVFSLKLTSGNLSIEVGCAVRYLTDDGMGIEFTEINSENDRKLRKLLDQIRV